MEFVIAMVLFVALIAAWLVAPGSTPIESAATPAVEATPELQRAI